MTDEHPAEDHSAVTRYIYSRKHFSKIHAKYPAFIPPEPRYEISVCVIDGMDDQDMWTMSPESRGPPKARADLKVSDITAVKDGDGHGLQVLIDGKPHPRHANIKSIVLKKALEKTIAVELAEKSVLHIKKHEIN